MLLPILSACGFAAAAGIAPGVLEGAAGWGAALGLAFLSIVMAVLAADVPLHARKDPS